MGKLKYPNLIAFFLMFVGAAFSSGFQGMAYLGPRPLWYWVGAGITYVTTIAALILLGALNKARKESSLTLFTKVIGIIICTLILLWTTFLLIAGVPRV
ncbi:hypothetical protein ABWW58_12500 [Sporolactobacillus sp. STCC-11]|uniref:hypothetical protein n=1 Tax=Sporolactobacillus caesalpiniae TaxID=3230362 RepID=UPI003392D02C